MYTIVTKKIDNIEIISFIDTLKIDPVRSAKEGKTKYSGLKQGEYEITDDQKNDYTLKLNALKNKQFLCVDGSIIDDYRGKTEYNKIDGLWQENKIDNLNTIITGKFHEELTQDELIEIQEQKEKERLESLTDEEKQKEFDNKKAYAMQIAINKKYELDILGDPDSLIKSQEWHQAELAKLEEAYK